MKNTRPLNPRAAWDRSFPPSGTTEPSEDAWEPSRARSDKDVELSGGRELVEILTVSDPSPSKKRCQEPVVDSNATLDAAHESLAPPEATLLRMRQAKSLGLHSQPPTAARLLIVRRKGAQQWPSPAVSRCGIDSCPASLAFATSRRVGPRKLWLGPAGRASQDTPAACRGRRGPKDSSGAPLAARAPQDTPDPK